MNSANAVVFVGVITALFAIIGAVMVLFGSGMPDFVGSFLLVSAFLSLFRR